MYPDRDTLSNVPHSGYITTHDQGMVESGMTEGAKTLPLFLFRKRTQQHKHGGSSFKSVDFQSYPRRKT